MKKSSNKNDFYSFKNITEDSADLYILGEIKADSYWWDDEEEFSQNCLKDFLKTLKDIKDVKQINIYINSPGGEVFSGLNMYNALKRHKAHKTVYIDGMAASAASLVAMAGDKIIMPSNTFLMIHKPWTMAWGNSDELLKVCDTLDTIEAGMMNIYQDNLINADDLETIKQMVKEETWLNVDEAKKYFNNIEAADAVSVAACSNANINILDFQEVFNNYKNTPEIIKEKIKGIPQPPKENALIIDKEKEIKEYIKSVELLIATKCG